MVGGSRRLACSAANHGLSRGPCDVFTPEERDQIREWVFAIARADHRITGGAVTGSRSVGAEDRWSDIDTAFGVASGVALETIFSEWTDLFQRELDIAHFFDLRRGPTLYRVFLLSNSLEVDVSFTPEAAFGAHGPTFELVFGESVQPVRADAADIDEMIGYGWIYVLNARAAIERGRRWQAEHWISAIRDQGLALACLLHELPAAYARGVDQLDPATTIPWAETLVRSLDPAELRRALGAAADGFLHEVAKVRPALAERLRKPLSLDPTA
jgi:hypothetical protein